MTTARALLFFALYSLDDKPRTFAWYWAKRLPIALKPTWSHWAAVRGGTERLVIVGRWRGPHTVLLDGYSEQSIDGHGGHDPRHGIVLYGGTRARFVMELDHKPTGRGRPIPEPPPGTDIDDIAPEFARLTARYPGSFAGIWRTK